MAAYNKLKRLRGVYNETGVKCSPLPSVEALCSYLKNDVFEANLAKISDVCALREKMKTISDRRFLTHNETQKFLTEVEIEELPLGSVAKDGWNLLFEAPTHVYFFKDKVVERWWKSRLHKIAIDFAVGDDGMVTCGLLPTLPPMTKAEWYRKIVLCYNGIFCESFSRNAEMSIFEARKRTKATDEENKEDCVVEAAPGVGGRRQLLWRLFGAMRVTDACLQNDLPEDLRELSAKKFVNLEEEAGEEAEMKKWRFLSDTTAEIGPSPANYGLNDIQHALAAAQFSIFQLLRAQGLLPASNLVSDAEYSRLKHHFGDTKMQKKTKNRIVVGPNGPPQLRAVAVGQYFTNTSPMYLILATRESRNAAGSQHSKYAAFKNVWWCAQQQLPTFVVDDFKSDDTMPRKKQEQVGDEFLAHESYQAACGEHRGTAARRNKATAKHMDANEKVVLGRMKDPLRETDVEEMNAMGEGIFMGMSDKAFHLAEKAEEATGIPITDFFESSMRALQARTPLSRPTRREREKIKGVVDPLCRVFPDLQHLNTDAAVKYRRALADMNLDLSAFAEEQSFRLRLGDDLLAACLRKSELRAGLMCDMMTTLTDECWVMQQYLPGDNKEVSAQVKNTLGTVWNHRKPECLHFVWAFYIFVSWPLLTNNGAKCDRTYMINREGKQITVQKESDSYRAVGGFNGIAAWGPHANRSYDLTTLGVTIAKECGGIVGDKADRLLAEGSRDRIEVSGGAKARA